MQSEPTIECDVKLPDRLSELIRVAVKDCRSLDPDIYFPNSEAWHEPNDSLYGEGEAREPCHICLAGGVIAKSLGQPPMTRVVPNSFASNELESKLDALEEARRGRLIQALGYIAAGTHTPVIPPESDLETRVNAIPDPDFPGFQGFAEMEIHLNYLEHVADQLEALGL